MTQYDLAGQWSYLGTVTPEFENWLTFPYPSNSANPTVRLTFYDNDEFSKIGSYGFLRIAYNFPDTFYSKWVRVYPSANRVVFSFPIPKELLLTSSIVSRQFEIMKRNKYSRPHYRVIDTNWSCSVEVLDLINLTGETQILLNQVDTLEQVATIIQNTITEGDS